MVDFSNENASEKIMFIGFVRNALKSPENIAVKHYSKSGMATSITYGELLIKAAALSQQLRQRGVSRNENIGVMLPRGIDQLTAILAVQMSGCAYVPIRTSQPLERVGKIINTSDIRHMIVHDDFASADIAAEAIRLGDISTVSTMSVNEAAESLVIPDGDDTAYIIFTSGSTGIPKGVEIAHFAAMNTIDAINRIFSVKETDSALNVSSYDFDLSVYDFFGILKAGGTVVTIDEAISKEPEHWRKIANDAKVTVWNSVPAIFDMLCTASRNDISESLRCVLLSGDWVSRKLYFRLGDARNRLRFAALGGATEASIWSNIYEMSAEDESAEWEYVPYGKALPRQKYMIMTADGKECAVGTQGELWIGGKGLSKGYIGDEKTTAEHFVQYGGERWYRTGDAGYLNENGDIIFCGRLDSQVKINGYRIETEEIESVLARISGIRTAAVIKLEDRGKAMLAAALVAEADIIPTEKIKSILSERLPAYMIPEVIKYTSAIPLTANGKHDRKKLELLFAERRTADFEPPSTETEKRLSRLWKRALEADHIGAQDNFFVLGGDSLKATSLIADIGDTFLITLTLADIFSYPVLRDMANKIDEAAASGQTAELIEGEI